VDWVERAFRIRAKLSDITRNYTMSQLTLPRIHCLMWTNTYGQAVRVRSDAIAVYRNQEVGPRGDGHTMTAQATSCENKVMQFGDSAFTSCVPVHAT